MSKFKGTKGKWEFFINETSNGYSSVISDGNQEICICYGGFEKTKPDAKLIACAPEMLDLLSSIENDEKQVPKFIWDKIQLIIKKATE